MRLLKFLSSKQESLSGQLSDARTQVSASTEPVDAADSPVTSGHTPSRGSRSDVSASTQPVGVADTHIASGHLSPIPHNQLVDSISSGTMCNARSSVESALSHPAVSPPADDPTLCPTPELGMVTRLPDKPGCYLRHEGRHGQMYKHSSYSDVLIPVLHHGAVASGVDKCDLCHFHLDGTCRWATVAHMRIIGLRDWNGYALFVPKMGRLTVM